MQCCLESFLCLECYGNFPIAKVGRASAVNGNLEIFKPFMQAFFVDLSMAFGIESE